MSVLIIGFEEVVIIISLLFLFFVVSKPVVALVVILLIVSSLVVVVIVVVVSLSVVIVLASSVLLKALGFILMMVVVLMVEVFVLLVEDTGVLANGILSASLDELLDLIEKALLINEIALADLIGEVVVKIHAEVETVLEGLLKIEDGLTEPISLLEASDNLGVKDSIKLKVLILDIVENIIDEIGLFGLEASLNEVGIGDQSWFDSVLLHDFNDTHSLMNLPSSSIDLDKDAISDI
mmetsp:Transcript_41257/g.36589  ORF Transcript_41257/g.36589 Transcript_41257/m.36589 type:complete len:237 (-) Transcript_41257:443-1153(-)